VSEWAACVSDRKDGILRVEAQQVITREVEAPLRTTFDVAMQDMISLFPVGKTIHENLEVLRYAE